MIEQRINHLIKTRRTFESNYTFRLLSILILSFTLPQKDDPKTILLENISTQLEKDILIGKGQCFSITVTKNDSVVFFKGFGIMDKKHGTPPDSSTIFRLGSVTKSFTSILMLKLIEEGYFKLDDPIENYLPEVKDLQGYTNSTKITFRQLASHTSGLGREPTITRDLLYCSTSEWEDKILLAIPETKFKIRPGTSMLYSNIGYNILGLAMSRAAKVPFMKLVQDKIFTPLDMSSSYFEVPFDHRKRLINSTERIGVMHEYEAWRVASGGIYSTAIDLTKFVAMVMGSSRQKVLSEKSLTFIEQITSKKGDTNNGYATGLMVYDWKNDTKIFGHNGSTHGYKSCFAFDNLRKNGVILLVNYNTDNNLWTTSINILKKLAELDGRK